MTYSSSSSGGLRASHGFLSHACGALLRRTFLSSSKVFDSIARLYLQFGGEKEGSFAVLCMGFDSFELRVPVTIITCRSMLSIDGHFM